MLSKGPLVRVWSKQSCGARKPAQAPRRTRYARKQNVHARVSKTQAMPQAFPYLVPGCKTFRTWLKWDLTNEKLGKINDHWFEVER